MRSLVRAYVLTGLCFTLAGMPIMSVSLAVASAFVDHWSADQVPLPATVLFGILGTLQYGVFLPVAFGVPIVVATLAFVACMNWGASTRYRAAAGAIAGAVSGSLGAVVWRSSELVVTPQTWLTGSAAACVVACAAAGAITAWLYPRSAFIGRSAPPARTQAVEATHTPAMPARLAAGVIAAAVAAWLLPRSTPTVDDARFLRDAKADAVAMRAAPVDEQSARIGALLDHAPTIASISERKAGSPLLQRAIRDRGQLASELASLKRRGGPVVQTRHKDFAASLNAHDLSRGLNMTFEDSRASGAATETFGYDRRDGKLVLRMYNYIFSGPRGDPEAYQALLIQR